MFSRNPLLQLSAGLALAIVSFTSSAGWSPLSGGWGGASWSQHVCPGSLQEVPIEVKTAAANAGIPLVYTTQMQCFEADGEECPAGTHGIETNLSADDGVGFVFYDNTPNPDTIERTDGGSFLDDGMFAGLAIRITNAGVNNGDVTIAGVTGSVITLSDEDSLTTAGTASPINGWIYSYLVTHRLTGISTCYFTLDDGTFDTSATPVPILPFEFDVTYTANERDCTGAECMSTGYITDNPPHDISGTLIASDGTNAADHNCSPDVPCMACVQELTSADTNDKKLADYYAANAFYDLFQSFDMVEHSDGSADIHSRAATSRTFATLDPSPAQCAGLRYVAKGSVLDATEAYTGGLQLEGKVVGGSVQVGGNSDTDVTSFDFYPEDYFTCADVPTDENGIPEVLLAGAVPPQEPFGTPGDGRCTGKYNKNALAAALDAISPLEDGEIVAVTLTGCYNSESECKPFSASDIARVEFNSDITVGFAQPSSSGAEGEVIEVAVQLSKSPVATVKVTVDDLQTGSAGKRDYVYPAPGTVDEVTFGPDTPLTQSVYVQLIADNPPDAGETINFTLTGLEGAAMIDGANNTHQLTIN